ncbi:Nucleolar protein 12 [Cytospora paraplurivora]|uniref:Nucleolar protein 12 n=1 Tax=Cytospora paraplurivora TaxID=2898453 RepID=A0AAN9YJS3_9PEZI
MAKNKSTVLSASSKKIDPTLDALFSASAGPVQAPPKSRYSGSTIPKSTQEAESEDEDDEDDEVLSELSEDDEADETSEGAADAEVNEESDSIDSEEDARDAAAQILAEAKEQERKQKKKRKQDDFHDLESKYFQKLADEEPPASKKQKGSDGEATKKVASSRTKEGEDESDFEAPVHESLAQKKPADELEKASRTVFLSNVSIEAANTKKAKKTLLAHLSSVLEEDASPPQTLESLRFRSLPFSTAAMPKRAAYITKATMEATTHSANAYVVYSTVAAARAACAKLNGTIVLGRHLRVDSVAHPAEVDHRRCVFVGNLGFVDDETVLNLKIDEEGKEKTEKRKRTRVPMDVEEGLWRTFGQHAGKVESVRVVRDNVTRVGKGIAYVQFYDGNSVEAALLLNGKRFPPMLPRDLRVNRCKAPYKTARAIEKKQTEKIAALKATGKAKKGYVPKLTAEEQTLAGRAGKLLGHSAAAKARISKNGGKPRDRKDRGGKRPDTGKKEGGPAAFKSPEAIVFEGRRASSKDAKPKDLRQKQRKAGSKAKKSKK